MTQLYKRVLKDDKRTGQGVPRNNWERTIGEHSIAFLW